MIWIDLKVYDTQKLSMVHNAIKKILNLTVPERTRDKERYAYFTGENKILDMNKQFGELRPGNKIYMELSTSKKRTLNENNKVMRKYAKMESMICMQNNSWDQKIEVVCSTRIFDQQVLRINSIILLPSTRNASYLLTSTYSRHFASSTWISWVVKWHTVAFPFHHHLTQFCFSNFLSIPPFLPSPTH